MRYVIAYGDPEPLPSVEDEIKVRSLIGRACLVVNSLLVSREQAESLISGTADEQRVELMTQWLSSFELANPSKAEHLMPRLEIMFRVLLQEPHVKARIASCSSGFDFEAAFETYIGITLDSWLFVIFAMYAYFLNIGSALDPDQNYMMINPSIFRGESGITQHVLETVLEFTSATPADIRAKMDQVRNTDTRYDFVEFRSTPLMRLEATKLVPADISFILDKCHTGVQWALHDRLSGKMRRSLFNAWGALFEEYVHWLLRGMKTPLPMIYFPSPKWSDDKTESFDGVLLQGAVMMPAEYKGGFVAREARYSGRSEIFLREIDKKFAAGCDQLARKIGEAFSENESIRRTIEGFDCGTTRAVVPVLILQDHILRVPLVNWYLNLRFQEHLRTKTLRHDVVVRPLTVIVIDELESIVHSVESKSFDFIYALQHRTVRDPEVRSELVEFLSLFPEFGHEASPRLKEILERVTQHITTFLFPPNIS